jgi:hypothetical protein
MLSPAGATTTAAGSSSTAAMDATSSQPAAQLKHGRHGIEYMQCLATFSLRTGQVSAVTQCCLDTQFA